ncbi:AMP-binding protein [Sphingomonas sp. 1P06PA]|uniref:AMP-binding protein n=1 Tax=Sphingomonas sp. 1P06PA TaxID=554121 RepID=UPI0039A41AF3
MRISARQGALAAQFAPWRPLTLHGALDLAAARFPHRPFVLDDRRVWTYSEIAEWSSRLAAGLAANRVQPGDRVAIVLGNSVEFVALKFAISRTGAVAVPVNILNRRDELRYVLEQSDAVMLVTMDRFRDLDYLAMLDEINPDWGSGSDDRTSGLRQVVVLPMGEAPPRPGTMQFADLAGDMACPAVQVAPDDLCDIIYTSGTTGPPKGVMLTHDMLTRTSFGSAYARAFEDGRRIVFALPMYHVFGYCEGMLAVLWVGGAIVPQLKFDADSMLKAIARHRVTDALLIPMMTLALIEGAKAGAYDLTTLSSALSSGARAPERVWAGLRDILGVAEITTGYGMTETTASTTVTRPHDPEERLLTTNGRLRDVGPAGDDALKGRLVQYRVVDPETDRTLACGQVGELRARGPGVTSGYFRNAEATAAAFDADGWLRTGDLGRIDADDYISLVGRSKESYRCGGELVLPTEVEDLLTTHPAVIAAHVVPLPDDRMGEVGVAFVVLRDAAQVAPDELVSLVAERLARFKVPRHVLIVDASAIPTTASGRARKFLLSQRAAEMLAPA